jgi:hypothetical protein
MSDQFTEITVESWGARIGGSIVAALIGLLLLAATLWGLTWNEGHAVATATALRHATASVVEVTPGMVDHRNEGRMVHLTGLMKPATPAWDPVFGAWSDRLLRLSRKVETYQWQQTVEKHSQQNPGGSKTTETTYHYQPIWSDRAINSAMFRDQFGHENPPVTLQDANFYGQGIQIGAYQVSPGITYKLRIFTPLDPEHVTPPSGFRKEGGFFYSGQNPTQPAIGDTRVRFEAVPAQIVSVAAAQWGNWLTPFADPNGTSVALAEPGIHSAATLLLHAEIEATEMTWAARAAGFTCVFFAFLLMSQPLRALAAVLPFLETMVAAGTGALALALAIPVTLVTIALAWLSFRPLIAGLLLAAALLTLVLPHLRARRPARV